MRFTLHTIALIPSLFLFSACAHDHYDATTGNPALLSKTLSSCKWQVQWDYAHSRDHTAVLAGVVLGGAVGGAAAGMAGGADHAIPVSSLNGRIEDCMAQHGYTGTSEN